MRTTKTLITTSALALLCGLAPLQALQSGEGSGGAVPAEEEDSFSAAMAQILREVDAASAALVDQQQRIADEKLPLARDLSRLEAELLDVRSEYQEVVATLDSRSGKLQSLQSEIERRKNESTYLENLLSQYNSDFKSRLHIAEVKRYEERLEDASLALENDALSPAEVFTAQLEVFDTSLGRMEEALGGLRFEGKAVGADGVVRPGDFLMLGPAAIFQPRSEGVGGIAVERLGSLEPNIAEYGNPEDAAAAAQLISSGTGFFPLDPTLGDAIKVEATQETFLEHVQKGGQVMYPIFAMAGAALLVALYKWASMLFIGKPSRKKVNALLDAVSEGNEEEAQRKARAIGGPVGRMLQSGAANMREPRELVEEILYEDVLRTRFKLNGLLPFIAICAASAPLLGLLGTVTGIINTFKLINVFGSGDVKSLSGGISEALITTKFGLIVAIPSLLLHSYLSRKARGVVGQMESAAVAFVNQLAKTPLAKPHVVVPASGGQIPEQAEPAASTTPDPDLVRAQVNEILGQLLTPIVEEDEGARRAGRS